MGFATEALTAIQAAITARLAGGQVDSYTLPDGTNIQTCPLEKLWAIQAEVARLADVETSGSPFRRVRLRPR